MELYQRVREVAKKLAPSQGKFAAQLGLSDSTFSQYLKKERQDNLWPFLHRIMDLYPQLNRDWLFHGEGSMFHNDATPAWPYGTRLLCVNPDIPDDALGRLMLLTGKNVTDANVLAGLFGTDFKEMRKFIARYLKARREYEEYKRCDSDDDAYSDPPNLTIPVAWLKHFCENHIFNHDWIQYGEDGFKVAQLLLPRRIDERYVALEGENKALRETNAHLLKQLAELAASRHYANSTPEAEQKVANWQG